MLNPETERVIPLIYRTRPIGSHIEQESMIGPRFSEVAASGLRHDLVEAILLRMDDHLYDDDNLTAVPPEPRVHYHDWNPGFFISTDGLAAIEQARRQGWTARISTLPPLQQPARERIQERILRGLLDAAIEPTGRCVLIVRDHRERLLLMNEICAAAPHHDYACATGLVHIESHEILLMTLDELVDMPTAQVQSLLHTRVLCSPDAADDMADQEVAWQQYQALRQSRP